jgi:regulatory protein
MSAKSNLSKARAYCARQERCQQEVRDKLYSWGSHKEEVEQIISQLIGEGFLNEARFAEHYAVSKSRQKGWGAKKIEYMLRSKGISEPCVRSAMKSIDVQERNDDLAKAVLKRWEKIKDADPRVKRQKVIQYFIRKGFDLENIETNLRKID